MTRQAGSGSIGFGASTASTALPDRMRVVTAERISAIPSAAMATRKEVLEIGGREVTVTQPRQGLLPRRRATRSSTSSATTSRSPTARCAASGGRPMALKRFVDGIDEGAVLPEAGARQPARLDAGRDADVPVRADGGRDRARRGGRRSPGSPTSAASTSTRTRSAPTTSTTPTSCASTSTRCPGVPVVAGPRGRAASCSEALEAVGPRRLAEDVRLARHPHQRPDRAALDVRAGPAGGAGAGPRRRARARRRSRPSKWWKEERHGVFLDYNQNAKDRTVASAYSVRPLPDARVSFPLRWDEVADVVAEDFTLATVPALYAERGDAGAGHRRRGRARSRRCSSCQRAARGRGPGRRAVAAELREAGGRAAARPAVAEARRPTTEYERPRQGRRPAARGRRGARRGRRGRRPQRRPADRVGGLAPDADRPPQDEHPGHRDRPGRDEGRGARGPRALEGAPPRGRAAPRAGRRPRRRDARPLLALVPASGST